MTTLTPDLAQQIAHLTPTQQTTLAVYLQTHLDQILAAAEKERRIATGTYTLDDFNEETQETIRNIENGQGLTEYESLDAFYQDLDS